MAFRKRPGDRKPLDPEPDKPREGVTTYSANDPDRERLARRLERGMCG